MSDMNASKKGRPSPKTTEGAGAPNIIEEDPFIDLYNIEIDGKKPETNRDTVETNEDIDAALEQAEKDIKTQSLNNVISPAYYAGYAPAPLVNDNFESGGATEELITKNVNGIYLYEDPMFETEFNIKQWESFDNDGYFYDNVYVLIREFRGDRYARRELKAAAENRLEMLRVVMDCIRHSLEEISPYTDKNYVESLSKSDRNRLQFFVASTMEKRMGQARLIIRARYGFPLNINKDNLKVTVYEHSDPFEIFQHSMEMLEPAYNVLSRKSVSSPSTSRATTKNDTIIDKENGSEKPQQSDNNNGIITNPDDFEPEFDCDGDEDAQNAEFFSCFRYYATKVSRGRNGQWTFYMPQKAAWRKKEFNNFNNVRGIYFYENMNPSLIKTSIENDVLPSLQEGVTAAWHVIIDVQKIPTKNGMAKFNIINMELPE